MWLRYSGDQDKQVCMFKEHTLQQQEDTLEKIICSALRGGIPSGSEHTKDINEVTYIG